MDLLLYFLAFVMGALSFRLIFGGARPGPFEQSLMKNLLLGKRVVVSIDDDCFIFEMIENRLRITRGMTTFMENPYVMESDGMDSSPTNKPDDDIPDGA